MSNTDNVFPIGLRLEPNHAGMILGLEEVIDEKLYNMLVDGNSLTTETKKGKIELGYTETSGVVVKMVVSNPVMFDEAISVINDTANAIVMQGIKDDPGFSDKPRTDLKDSLTHLEIVLDDSLVKAYPKLSRYPFSHLSSKVRDPFTLSTVEKIHLVPDGYEVEYK